MKLEALKEKKTQILDDVMEKETYKVAKEILDKFGQTQLGARSTGGLAVAGKQVGAVRGGQDENSQLRRRAAPATQTAGRLNTSLPVTAISSAITASSATKLNTSMAPVARSVQGPGVPQGPSAAPQGPSGAPHGPSGASGAAAPIFPSRPQGPGGLSRSAPGPPLPRPVLPRERGYMDKFVEFLVGDGPANRYALICRQCQSHNGMALREEFEYVAFRCCYCYYWNPARKQRPVAPRLQAAVTSATDSSSGSDQSGASSAAQSRRGSVAGLEEEVTAGVEKEISNTVIPTDDEAGVLSSDIEIVSKAEISEVEDQVLKNNPDIGLKLDDENLALNENVIKDDGDNAMEVDK